jgi:hypothetical protein
MAAAGTRREHRPARSPVRHAARSAAARLALRLALRDVPVITYGYDIVGALVSRRLGCDVVEGELDLAKLCVAGD